MVKATVIGPKVDGINKLRDQVAHLEWQTAQRQEELKVKREALTRRCEHLRDTQRLYEAALSQVLAAPAGEMEGLVDRMVHQSVPTRPNITANE